MTERSCGGRAPRGPAAAETVGHGRLRRPRSSRSSPTSSATTPRRRPTPPKRSPARPTSRGCVPGIGVRARHPGARPPGVPRRDSPTAFSTEHSGRGVNLLTLPSREGVGVRGRVPSTVDRRRAPVPVGTNEGRPARGTAAPLTSGSRGRAGISSWPWPVDGRSRPSPFLDELELSPSGPPLRSSRSEDARRRATWGALFDRLKEWRRKRGTGGRRAGLRRVPRPDAGRDRRAQVQDWADLACGLGRRTRQARAVRGRDP